MEVFIFIGIVFLSLAIPGFVLQYQANREERVHHAA